MSTAQGCGRLDDVVAELALGLLDGAERADALAHTEQCAVCQQEVAQLTELGEQLLLMAPEIPPPLGFESRVMARLSAPPRQRRRRRFLLGAAAVVVAVTLAVAGIGLWRSDREPAVGTATMRSPSGEDVGDVTLHPGSPGAVEVDVSDWVDELVAQDEWPHTQWWLSVEDVDGDYARYEISLADPLSRVSLDDAEPGSPHITPDEVAIVAIVDDAGNVWCRGKLRDLR